MKWKHRCVADAARILPAQRFYCFAIFRKRDHIQQRKIENLARFG